MDKSPSWEANRFSLLKTSPAFYGARRFITAFTTGRNMSLSWTKSIQSTLSQPISLIPILILSSHLRLDLPNGPFPQVSSTEPCMGLFYPSFVLCVWRSVTSLDMAKGKIVEPPSNTEVAGICECNAFCTSGNDTNHVSFQHITLLLVSYNGSNTIHVSIESQQSSCGGWPFVFVMTDDCSVARRSVSYTFTSHDSSLKLPRRHSLPYCRLCDPECEFYDKLQS
jgi:hypothetical protein